MPLQSSHTTLQMFTGPQGEIWDSIMDQLVQNTLLSSITYFFVLSQAKITLSTVFFFFALFLFSFSSFGSLEQWVNFFCLLYDQIRLTLLSRPESLLGIQMVVSMSNVMVLSVKYVTFISYHKVTKCLPREKKGNWRVTKNNKV